MILIIAWEASMDYSQVISGCHNHLDGIYYTQVRHVAIFMLSRLKNALIGSPLPTQQLSEKRLNKIRALAAFSPDALSSIAYANQEIYLGLLVAGSAGLGLAWPIGLAITLLLVIVAMSYFQTIQGYPSGGGSYVVARENLGNLPGLIAGAALLIDYLLTAAVSLTAGVEAIASAFPSLYKIRVEIALVLLFLITIANLRGLRETGTIMAIPVYLFLLTYLPMLVYGLVVLFTHGRVPIASVAPPAAQPLTLFLILHTFATGCTALTGVEAISNGVPAFKSPESKNAGRTLIVMAVLMGILFAGSIGLTQFLGIIAAPHETILSALARKSARERIRLCPDPIFNDAYPGSGCQHQLRWFSSPGCHPGQGWLSSSPIHRLGRPPRLCQWHRFTFSSHGSLDHHLWWHQPPIDPALRRGGFPCIHTLAGWHGQALVA